jgi:hypothetical protein
VEGSDCSTSLDRCRTILRSRDVDTSAEGLGLQAGEDSAAQSSTATDQHRSSDQLRRHADDSHCYHLGHVIDT